MGLSIQPFTLITFTAVVFYACLLWITLTRRARSRLHLYFSLYLASMIVWSMGAFLVYAEVPLFTTLTWNRLMIVGTMGMPIAFFGFVQVYLQRDWKIWLRIGLLAFTLSLVANWQGWIVQSARLQGSQLIFDTGWAMFIPVICWVFYLSYSTYSLVVELATSQDTNYKAEIRHLLVVIMVIFAGAITDAIPALKVYPIDILFNALAALLIVNAIIRHQFLDINIVIRKGLFYSIPTVLIGATYFLIISLVYRLFPERTNLQVFLVSLVVAVIAAVLARPVLNRAQDLIDRFFFREKYDGSIMIQRVSHTAASLLDLKSLTQMILDEVCGTLHARNAAFFLLHSESGEYFLLSHRGLESVANIRLSRTNPIVVHLSAHSEVLDSYEISVQPQFRALWGVEREALEQIHTNLFIPLKAKGELVGIFAVGEKLSGQNYTQDDRLTLITLANQTAVAIENARLYSAEQSRREELTAMYDLTRQLVATDDVSAVLASTTRHVVDSLRVTFGVIMTPRPDGTFAYRAAYPTNPFLEKFGYNRPLPKPGQRLLQEVSSLGEAVILYKDTGNLDDDTRDALLLNTNSMLCIAPLRVGDEAIGILLVGNAVKSENGLADPDKLRVIRNMADQAANALLRADLHEQMEDSFVQTVLALAAAAESRDKYTQGHDERTVNLAEELAKEFDLSEELVKAIHWAGYLHDIGKIGIPDEILNKPGALSQEEWAVMKRHPIIGARIVAPVKRLANVAPIIRAHHERYDGTGYPHGLKGVDIPIGARIISVVDAYVAMTDDRVYRAALSHAQAVAELERCSGTQFDPQMVEAFLKILDRGVHMKMRPIIFEKDLSMDKTRPLKRPFSPDA